MEILISLPFRVLNLIALVCIIFVANTQAQWQNGRATNYKDAGGYACGYNTGSQGYGREISAVSAPLFQNGAACGACYEVMCVNSPNCYKVAGSIKVTATDFCPSSSGPDAWCNPPQKHFDLSYEMFTKIAPYKAGVVPVQFRRIPCSKQGGVRFTIDNKSNQQSGSDTNNWWLEILVHNVGSDGVVSNVKVKGSRTGWMQMNRNWGQNWDVHSSLNGQSLSFQVTISSGKTLMFNDVVPSNWRNGQTFDGRINF